MDHYIEQLVDLIEPTSNCFYTLSLDAARERVLRGPAESVRAIEGSFALVARHGKTVRMARSLDRPMRYFLAKRAEGPALIVADRIDTIYQHLQREGLAQQFHPSYTRMVPAHHVVEIQLVGCPDPDPVYTRFFDPQRNTLSTDLDEIGSRYIGALADEIAKWLRTIESALPLSVRNERGEGRGEGHPTADTPAQVHAGGPSSPRPSPPSKRGEGEDNSAPNTDPAGRRPHSPPIGVCFSGGIDSGAVFLTTYHVMRRLGLNPSRLKAFTLSFGDGPDLDQARQFLDSLGLGLFLEPIEADLGTLDVGETIRVLEDYKPLDVECASMGLTLCRGIRGRYPDWRHLIDGDGGDENLKDYPIEENPELTIRSVVNNTMLYQEGWGVGRIKHSLTYSGGLSRSYARTYAPAKHFGFEGFSPFTKPNVIEVAEGIPFTRLTEMSVEKLYALKGEIVARGVKAITGLDMPVFPKRRFQHGAVKLETLRKRVPGREQELRRQFLALYA